MDGCFHDLLFNLDCTASRNSRPLCTLRDSGNKLVQTLYGVHHCRVVSFAPLSSLFERAVEPRYHEGFQLDFIYTGQKTSKSRASNLLVGFGIILSVQLQRLAFQILTSYSTLLANNTPDALRFSTSVI